MIDERLQTKTKEFTRLTHTGLVVELEHLEIETRLIDEKFANAMGEYVTPCPGPKLSFFEKKNPKKRLFRSRRSTTLLTPSLVFSPLR